VNERVLRLAERIRSELADLERGPSYWPLPSSCKTVPLPKRASRRRATHQKPKLSLNGAPRVGVTVKP